MSKLLIALISVAILSGCGDKKEASPPPKEVAAPAPNLKQMPDVGGVELVLVKTTGTGMTPGAAVNEALKSAIAQVNGATIVATSVNQNGFSQVTAQLDVETSQGKDSLKVTETVQGQAFADRIISQSKGTVASFKVISIAPPTAGNTLYTVEVEANIAKFKAPADSGKIKIVVAPLQSTKTSFNIGGRAVPANEVLGALRQQIIDSLSQTGRFIILDRQFEGELQNELSMISSGKSVNTDFAKLGQALSADLVWVGVVNDFTYDKHVRKLQTSDRELVSFTGGWSVSQRMINLATRQIFQSGTLQGSAPAIPATTLGTNFDESSTLKTMNSDVVKKSVEAILLRTFPISVVERDGMTVVLSQGGQAVTENGRYQIYLQGKEIKDPQTGQSLGNMESLCCEVTITRVTPNLSYGTLDNVKVNLDSAVPGSLQIREAIVAKSKPAKEPEKEPEETAPKVAPVTSAEPAKKSATQAPKPSTAKKDDW
jgi:curli biogenesis system outer membrane secretion channel CsgG